ncbi:MAG: 2-oxo/hydroxy acid reductase [Novosphingobium lindaniclasticum]|jgi:lactate dehydrogenase-like 2-hydroxyacid dehydrogenase|uniref:2-hydroxyacid dehydrogenase n=1 Tax=Novosphingobium lindaniclasticum TaxID=1329895 RepID=UPI00240953B4|nr:2-hydroxyacid dehydrogenase [Novosphingobium lindaniclasticum]MDF2638491.1 2-oxo/hydroxy acid reductase [Novosphingobium lindaniclasticum]
MKPLVIAAAPLSPWLTARLEARYRVLWLHQAADMDQAMAEGADQAEVLITTGIHGAAAELLAQLPALKVVAVHGVGYDKVDLGYASSHNIAVTNTPDVLTDDVADMALALILATARRIASNDRFVRNGSWGIAPIPQLGRKVSDARFGIIGLGRIGNAIAKRLEGFSTNIAYHNRKPVPGSRYTFANTAAELANMSDFLIVAASGGTSTERLVDDSVLNALGSDGILINIGRGSTIDEPALVAALADGRIAGAGLDVFTDEPSVPAELMAMEQVVLQPHQASATIQTRIAMADIVVTNVDAYFSDQPLPTKVN